MLLQFLIPSMPITFVVRGLLPVRGAGSFPLFSGAGAVWCRMSVAGVPPGGTPPGSGITRTTRPAASGAAGSP